MTVPLRVGIENPEEENQFIEELNIARNEKLEQISYHLINSGGGAIELDLRLTQPA